MAVAGKPYVFINDQVQGYATLKARVGGGAKFDVVNEHIRNLLVMPGQLVIVGDDSTANVTREEIELMGLAQNVRHQLRDADSQILENDDLLQKLLNYGSLGIGSVTDSWSKHLGGVQKTLEDIEQLYQLSLKRGTPIARQEFINQRRVLFSKLDTQLEGIARWGTGLHNRGSLKKMLGLSTKSYSHTQELRGYAQRIGKIAKASKLLKTGTPVGIGLNGLSTYLQIEEACSTGREDMCTKTKYIEGGKLVGGVAAGYYLGGLGATAAAGLCVIVFGIPTFGAGAIGCGIVGGTVVGYTGGMGGEKVGESAGEMLYEWGR